jgi:RNA 2',3'-cyclic 3'-phosphodiesterase
MGSSDQHRLFIGTKVSLSKEISSFIEQLQIKFNHSGIKWVERNNYHITLKFLGQTPSYFISSIDMAIRESIRNLHPFDIQLSGCGFFGTPSPKVLWLGLKKTRGLEVLQDRLNYGLYQLGFNIEQRPFKPHLTIGRIKFLNSIPEFKQIIRKYTDKCEQSFLVNKIELFESKLLPAGPQYTALKQYQLNFD